jgi:HEAT repeat protein
MTTVIRLCILALAVSGLIDPLSTIGAAREPNIEGRAFSQWVTDLYAPGEPTQQRARAVIKDFGTNGLPLLLLMLYPDPTAAPHPSPHRSAIRAFEVLGETASPAIPELKTLLESRSPHSLFAAEALKAIGPKSTSVFARALSNADPEVRIWAAYSLQSFGTNSALALPELLIAASDLDPRVRANVAAALGATGQPDKALPVLMSMLSNPDRGAGDSAATAIGEFGPAASPAIPLLVKQLDSTYPHHAAGALARIGKAAVPALTTALSHANPRVRTAAADALGRVGSDAISAIPALEKAQQDTDGFVRVKADYATRVIKRASQKESTKPK